MTNGELVLICIVASLLAYTMGVPAWIIICVWLIVGQL